LAKSAGKEDPVECDSKGAFTNITKSFAQQSHRQCHFICSQWAKSPKKQSVGVYFWQQGTVFWVPN